MSGTDWFVETLVTGSGAGIAPLDGVPGYVRTFHLPEDETAFHLFRGLGLQELRDVLARAAVSYERIVLVSEWTERTREHDTHEGVDHP